MIQSGTQVTYEVKTRFRVKVLAMQGGQGQDWVYIVLKDRLDERYDNVTVLESSGKSQISGKRGQRGGRARVGD